VACGSFVVHCCSSFFAMTVYVSNSGPLPPPPWGYFAAMLFVLIGLRWGCVCKIFITNGLLAKY
jgi:hypothetical protein